MTKGFKVTKTPTPYPFELSTKELVIHRQTISEYKPELSKNLYEKAQLYKPDLSLILQQPELNSALRQPCLEFLLRIAIKTKVTHGIFYQAVKIFDRYCSKRIVLRIQLQLVLTTCLWIAAKTYGGCNHVLNHTNIPPGGRFIGPNPRSRVPRLSELVQLCSNKKNKEAIDQSMFVQMERHILITLNWDITEPQLSNWLLEFYELNLLQLQQHNTKNCFDEKIHTIHIKRILFEISLFELNLIELHPETLSQVILHTLQDYFNSYFEGSYKFKSELTIQKKISKYELHYLSLALFTKLVTTLQNSQFLYNYYIIDNKCESFFKFILDKLKPTPSSPDIELSNSEASTPSSLHSKSLYETPNSTKSSLSLSRIITNTNNVNMLTPPRSKKDSPAVVNFQLLKIYQHQNNSKLTAPSNCSIDGGFTPPLTPVDMQ